MTSSLDAITSIDGQDMTILQLARQDLEATETSLDNHIEDERLQCRELEAKKLKSDQGEASPISKDQEIYIARVRESLNKRIALKSAIEEVKMPFGSLAYGPGISKHPINNSIRDWALVKLSDDRFQEVPRNIVSNCSQLCGA